MIAIGGMELGLIWAIYLVHEQTWERATEIFFYSMVTATSNHTTSSSIMKY